MSTYTQLYDLFLAKLLNPVNTLIESNRYSRGYKKG